MIEVLISLIILGFIDCLNPATIATMVILIPMVKTLKHAAIFIWGTFFTYFIVGVLFYYGIDKYIKDFVIDFSSKYRLEIAIIGVIIAVILFFFAIKLGVKAIKSFKSKDDIKPVSIVKITSVTPKAIVLLSIISTLSDAPTAIPYIAFISNLTANKTLIITIILLITIYCIIYISPMIALYISYKKFREKFNTFEKRFTSMISKSIVYLLPIVCFTVGVYIFTKSFQVLI